MRRYRDRMLKCQERTAASRSGSSAWVAGRQGRSLFTCQELCHESGILTLSRGATNESHRSGLNRRPLDYESSALPLSYCGNARGPLMPWLGFEPRRLAAPPPQDGVSTSFTTRARTFSLQPSALQPSETTAGATGFEPATSRVTVECSNQTELRPQSQHLRPARAAHSPNGSRTRLCTLKGCRPKPIDDGAKSLP
jgi:hypothetical protein